MLHIFVYLRGDLIHHHHPQWCSGNGVTRAIAPVPLCQGGVPLQFLHHLFDVTVAYILHKLKLESDKAIVYIFGFWKPFQSLRLLVYHTMLNSQKLTKVTLTLNLEIPLITKD